MANHQQKSLEFLEEVEHLEKRLRSEYLRGDQIGMGGPRSAVIADLHQRINRSLKKADIHATLSVRQALEDRTMQAASA